MPSFDDAVRSAGASGADSGPGDASHGSDDSPSSSGQPGEGDGVASVSAGADKGDPSSTPPLGESSEVAADVEIEPEQVQADIEALSAKAAKAEEYLELAQRTKADFENFRKRASRDAALAQERGVAKLAKELLPAVDNLDRALEAAEAAADKDDEGNGASPLVSGIKLVHADVIAALGRVGIEPFSPKGEPFDPQHHEAIAQTPVEGAVSGTVVEVYQRGYMLGEIVLRPARVVVAQ